MFKEYCTGCGLCASIKKKQMSFDDKGFLRISSEDKEDVGFFKSVCPAGGSQCSDMKVGAIWGREEGVFLAYSSEDYIRHMASSGGVLTSLAIFLLDNHFVDGVLQTKQNDEEPIGTVSVCSSTREQVLQCMGSRYSSSSPLLDIQKYIESGNKYAFIGKPCDITALRNYMRIEPKAETAFPYLLSFFCAGAPSRNANLELLKKLDCTEQDCVSLRYRGDGWPGYATAIDREGKKHQITYREAWRDTLGRENRVICRFCIDGIGEMADVACGDAWYLDEDKKPVFEEGLGRNVVLCRTNRGREIYQKAVVQGYIISEEYRNYADEMRYYQAYQYERKASLVDTLLAMRMTFHKTPIYSSSLLRSYSKNLNVMRRFSRFKGTLKRIYIAKI